MDDKDLLVGCVAVNRGPYTEDDSIARLRHLYLSPGNRLSGYGKVLVEK